MVDAPAGIEGVSTESLPKSIDRAPAFNWTNDWTRWVVRWVVAFVVGPIFSTFSLQERYRKEDCPVRV